MKHVPSIIQQIELVDTKGIIKRYYPGNDIEDDRLSFYYSLAAIIYEESENDHEYSQVLCFVCDFFYEFWLVDHDLDFLGKENLENIFFYLVFLQEKFDGFLMDTYGKDLNHSASLSLGALGGKVYKNSDYFNKISPIEFLKTKRPHFDFYMDSFENEKGNYCLLLFLFLIISNSIMDFNKIPPEQFYKDIKKNIEIRYSKKELLNFIDIIHKTKK